jgi:hypothetical protein
MVGGKSQIVGKHPGCGEGGRQPGFLTIPQGGIHEWLHYRFAGRTDICGYCIEKRNGKAAIVLQLPKRAPTSSPGWGTIFDPSLDAQLRSTGSMSGHSFRS